MSSLKNSSFGKRLRASHDASNENSPRRKRRRIDLKLNQDVPLSPSKKASSSSTTVLLTAATDITNTPVRRQKIRYSGESGDRFVPSRDTGSIRASYSLQGDVESPITVKTITSQRFPPDPVREQANDLYKSILRSELSACSPSRLPTTPSPSPRRVLTYNTPMTTPHDPNISPEHLNNPFDVSYQASPVQNETRSLISQPRPQIRKVDRAPYRCLDAPDLSDDFYTNLVDWSSSGILGVGLGGTVFLWRADNLSVSQLCSVASPKDEYSSVAWMKTENTVAVGTYDGHITIYDAVAQQPIRSYRNAHDGKRVGCLSWTSSIISSGSRDHSVQHHDIRDPSSCPFKTSIGHKQEVCGIKWSGDGGPDKALLASGGNDNKVCVWDLRGSKRAQILGVPTLPKPGFVPSPGNLMEKISGDMPLYKFHQHKAAVKGLAWDPHISGLLASGGGQRDRCIRFWNTTNGTMLNEIDTGSQVCNLLWSTNSHELVSTHGYSTTTVPNQICVWKYPTLTMVSSLVGHTQCVQYVALNPNGDTIVTGGGDQTLRFWSVFPGRTPPAKNEDSVLNHDKLIR
ncbi:substrate-specific activator of APC-dependent proteolysis [Marasmius crinis-equi]|uniref:Substrate-specific activator of APC-dependent proteolysis n=1 Tax=Marasmius crinis-equi TaxID=585013 RepID=A0ABR3F9Y2_9AGAR